MAGFEHNRWLSWSIIRTRLTRTIAPGTVVLLGDIAVDEAWARRESQFDDVQQHYFKELRGKDVRTALEESRFLGHQGELYESSGSLYQEYPSELASRQFMDVLSQVLPKAWNPWIENSKRLSP